MTLLPPLTRREAHPRPLARTAAIDAAIASSAWVVFNLSGGKDSSAAMFAVNAHLDDAGHPRERRMAIHADLGRAEWKATPAMVETVAGLAGLPLIVVRRAAGELFDRWAQRFARAKARYEALSTYALIGPWSSASLRFCTSEAKANVIGPAVAARLRGETVVSVIGLRRDESRARLAMPVTKDDERFARSGNRHGTKMTMWHPLVDWTRRDVLCCHERFGIPLHEAYLTYGCSRLSCRFCVLQSGADMRAAAMAASNRDAFVHLVGLEAESTFSFQPGRWLADMAPHLLSPPLERAIARAKADAATRRALEAAMPAGLRFVKGWPPRLPTSAEAEAIAAARAPILARHRLDDRFPTGRAVRDRFAQLVAARSGAG